MGETTVNPDFIGTAWLEWGHNAGLLGGLLLLVVGTSLVAFILWKVTQGPFRLVRIVLRSAAVALLLFLLLRPILVRALAEKSEAVVMVLYDDSASMSVRDEGSETRGARMQAALRRGDQAFTRALDVPYQRMDYRFSTLLRPLDSLETLAFSGKSTDTLLAVNEALRETQGLTRAAIILLSDGVHDGGGEPIDWDGLDTGDVPVYTVGVGEEAWRDLALHEVSLTESFLDDAPATIGARVDGEGMEAGTLVVEVLHGETVVATEERDLSAGTSSQQIVLEVPIDERDWQALTIRTGMKGLRPDENEAVAENNQRSVLFDHREKSYRVLYLGGRPNWQHKYLLRAMEGEPEIALASLVRISGAEKEFVFQGASTSLSNPLFDGFDENGRQPRYDEAIFLRLGLGPEELIAGYPTSAEELYPFDLIVWGDMEPDFFATPQLILTRDAVSERGASFLLFGGPGNTASDFSQTVMAPVLPTMPRLVDGPSTPVEGRVTPRPEAFLRGVWALDGDDGVHRLAWDALPPLPGVQAPGPARIGATVLATSLPADSSGGEESTPFLAWQTYGLGKGALLATGETWPWHLQTEAGNDAHGRLWRQMIRALVRDVPDPVRLIVDGGEVVEGVPATLKWTVRNELFEARSGAVLRVQVTDPEGDTSTVAALEALDKPGRYEARFVPAMPGRYHLRLEGEDQAGDALAPMDSALLAVADDREWRSPKFDEAGLRKLAESTGGRYFPLDKLGDVPDAIAASDTVQRRYEREPLWHALPFYLVLLILMMAEWALRRRAGQP